MTEQERLTAGRIARLLCEEGLTVSRLLGVQSQFLRTSKWTARARGIELDRESGAYFRAWTLRGTMHIHAAEDYALYMHAGNRSDYVEAYWGDHSLVSLSEKTGAEDRMLRLIEAGTVRRQDILRDFRQSGMSKEKLDYLFNAWGGMPRVLMERRSIIQTVSDELSYALAPAAAPMPAEQAEQIQMERYLRQYAPCAVSDAAYFFHYTRAKARRLMESAVANAAGTLLWREGFVLPREDELSPEMLRKARGVHVLSGFDPLLLGFEKGENPMIPREHLRTVYNLQGIVKPVILHKGRCAAVWTVRKGTVYISPFAGDESAPAACKRAEGRLRALTGCAACRYE